LVSEIMGNLSGGRTGSLHGRGVRPGNRFPAIVFAAPIHQRRALRLRSLSLSWTCRVIVIDENPAAVLFRGGNAPGGVFALNSPDGRRSKSKGGRDCRRGRQH